ncbi:MAG TPA: hypothetical protein VMN79_16190 [Casimicrobiaceae bacterium]|nr:hypothetical protein [Casimicrobiaceae bacterium]
MRQDLIASRFRSSRRTFLKAGVAGSAALLLLRQVHAGAAAPEASRDVLPSGARAVFAAIVPILLDGALPAGSECPVAVAQTLAAIEAAIAGLPPAARAELAELFSLLGFAPTRCLVAGVWSPWPAASAESVGAFLDRWRDSRFALLRSAYEALHQIVFAAWYAQPRAWPAIGYPGPPSIPSS